MNRDLNLYNKYKKIQLNPSRNMSLDERDFCLEILNNCKDISDSNQKVDGIGKCEILAMSLEKLNGVIKASGLLSISGENRSIEADIFIEDNRIIVDMLVTRLLASDKHIKYRVLDEFKVENGILKRRSQYNYDMENIYDNIENELMKGKIR